jgi:cyclic-di-GMP phosphodiesterase TipF (flagellum assembly factor)
MTILKHALFAAVYVLLALTVAVLLPTLVPGATAPVGWLAGGLTALAGAVLHEVLARHARDGEIIDRLYHYAQACERLQADLGRLEGDVLACRSAVAETMGGSEAAGKLEMVRSEVRILQSLVERLTQRAPVMADAEVDSGPVRRPPMSPDPVAAGDLADDEVLAAVREALKRDQVDLYLQPIVSLPQRKVRYYECFSRIRTGEDSMMLPDQYLGVTARAGLLGAIDNILLFRCVQLIRRAQKRRHNVGFFCNISAHTLRDRAFFADFSEFVAANAELAPQLVFELNQDDVANRWDEVAPFLMRLARLGFTFSLDRVTNLDLDVALLTRRHFRFVKLDVAGLLQRARQDVAGIAALKRALDSAGIDLIVEKIEEEADLIEALDFQIDFGQGYLFGGPQKSREA